MAVCIAGVRCAKLCMEANPSGLEVSEIPDVCSYLTSFHSSWVYFKRVEWHCQVWSTSYGHSLCSLWSTHQSFLMTNNCEFLFVITSSLLEWVGNLS